MTTERIGNLVKYVGVQYPALAGMEGEIVAQDGLFATVQWRRGHANMPTNILAYELKNIRAYSKRFR